MSARPCHRAAHGWRSDLVTSRGMINQRHRAAIIGEATLLAVISREAAVQVRGQCQSWAVSLLLSNHHKCL